MAKLRRGPRLDTLKRDQANEFFVKLQDAIILELVDNWNGQGDFNDEETWNQFMIAVAERMDLSREYLNDPATRQEFESWLIYAGQMLKRMGLLKLT
jgi:hypothetical protein